MLKSAEKIVQILQANGFESYFAGGAVRDFLLGRKISDVDIATSATPAEVEKLFPHTKPLGREFGVILVIFGKHAFEVATFRGERNYDGRRPGEVFFTTAEEDAQRRDFTVNGMFRNPVGGKILDFVGGQKDLKKQILRFIGIAEERVSEDFLRILRGVRFRNLLNFEYDEPTRIAIQKNSHQLREISGERIRDELTKILEDENRGRAVRDLAEFGILEVVLPEIWELKNLQQPEQWHREGDCLTHSLAAVASLPKSASATLALATILHDVGKAETFREENGEISYPGHAEAGVQIAEKILRRLKFDGATRAKIVWLIAHHMNFFDIPKMRLARKHEFFVHPWFPDLVRLTAADIRGTSPADFSLQRKVVKEWKIHLNEKLLPAPKPLLNGDEISRELCVTKGPALGRLTRILRDAEIEGLVRSRKEAVEFLEKCLKR
ncbi:CCA tRNA nucleotidyltransferase [Candidatus Gracilibacteria bacterium]|nr:CCA tRNA nucleotidyltransferase [Candidatus Gracilibacteria bacterium]MCF7856794.1 CCA tRNA nucleotidyltransferase [Candidatus Gracilibacteria bacterium]MCF7897072.1 CCA tRNA nucleotidyltransferase [Candidatus Gracilibacteria bacterium]